MFKRRKLLFSVLLSKRSCSTKGNGSELSLHKQEITFNPQLINIIEINLKKIPKWRLKEQELKIEAKAGVLVPLCNVDGHASILFTKRASNLRKHAGEVCFPGGVTEMDDVSLLQTALRETEEEIGLKASIIRVLGEHNPTLSSSKIAVTPFVGFVGDIDVQSLVPNVKEIDQIFSVKVAELLDPTKHKDEDIVHRRKTKIYEVMEGTPIWGLTAFFLEVLLRDAIVPSLNKYFRINFDSQQRG